MNEIIYWTFASFWLHRKSRAAFFFIDGGEGFFGGMSICLLARRHLATLVVTVQRGRRAGARKLKPGILLIKLQVNSCQCEYAK